jgi:molecular chaperone DnaK (HSP70)
MGVAAKNQQTTNLKNTVVNFKRFLGRQFRDPVVQQEIQRNLPFSVVEQSDGSVGVQVSISNRVKV